MTSWLSRLWDAIFGMKDAPPVATEDARVMVVGINRYALPGIDLQYCVADAKAMYLRFIEMGVPPLQARMLLDKEATHRRYEEALEWCLDVKPGGWSVLYHSGHGTTVAEGPVGWDEYKPGKPGHGVDEALVLHDSSYARVFLDDDYARIIRGPVSNGVRHVGIFDTCFSGGMHRLVGGGRARFVRYRGPVGHGRIRRFGFREGMNQHLTISACQEAEVSIEAVMPDGSGHGAFTYHFLKCFSTAATWEQAFGLTLRDMRVAGVRQTPAMVGGGAIRVLRPFDG